MLPLRFFRWDNDTLLIELNVPWLDVPCLLRTTAGMPDEKEKIAEGIRKFNSDARHLEEFALSQVAERVG